MFTHTVLVVRNFTQPVIIGWEFFACIFRSSGFERASVQLLTASQTILLDCNVITATPLTVPAMSQMSVLARVQPNIGVLDLESDYTAVIEPGPPNGQGLLGACTVALVSGRDDVC